MKSFRKRNSVSKARPWDSIYIFSFFFSKSILVRENDARNVYRWHKHQRDDMVSVFPLKRIWKRDKILKVFLCKFIFFCHHRSLNKMSQKWLQIGNKCTQENSKFNLFREHCTLKCVISGCFFPSLCMMMIKNKINCYIFLVTILKPHDNK